jgi:uncharacterized protein
MMNSKLKAAVCRTPNCSVGAIILLVIVSLIVTGCSGNQDIGRPSTASADPIVQERAQKDAAFRSAESPIPPLDRVGFRGLSYFPVDSMMRFSVRLHRYPVPGQIRLGTNTGEIRGALRYGYFDLKMEGQECRLQAYRLQDNPEEGGPSLFIPFRDATSGKETYAAGRYIDLKENTSGIYELDFNRAYNPFCAYNTDFSCPVAPSENTLKVPIRAGEKIYPGSHQ